MVALATLIALGEIDRLIAGVMGSDGRSHQLNVVIGPLAFTEQSAWAGWASSELPAGTGSWIIASLVIDAVFVLSYVQLLKRLLHRAVGDGVRISGLLLGWLVVAELVELILVLCGALILIYFPALSFTVIPFTVALVATIKWALAILLAVAILRNSGTRSTLSRIGSRVLQAIWVHRLTAVVVVVLIGLSCVPSDGVLDQLPDLQRQWLDDWRTGLVHLIVAAAALMLASLVSFVLGRQRTRASIDTRVRMILDSNKAPGRQWLWWLIPVGAWAVAAMITGTVAFVEGLAWSAGLAQFNPHMTITFLSIPLVLVVVLLMKRFPNSRGKANAVSDPERAIYTWLVGDVLAVVVLSVGGLGLVRSFTGPVFLGLEPDKWPFSVLLFVVGILVAVYSPRLLNSLNPEYFTARQALWVRSNLNPRQWLQSLAAHNNPVPVRSQQHLQTARWWLFGILCVGALIILAVTVLPLDIPRILGGVGVTVLLLSAWVAILGAFTVVLQDYQLHPLFKLLRLRAAPVLTLAITIPLALSALYTTGGADPTVHAVRTMAESPPAAGAAAAVATATNEPSPLLKRLIKTKCLATTPDGRVVKPVVVVAAEGGGIRAAFWTTEVLAQLDAHGGCLSEAVLVSSGVSGGSVGLALTHVVRDSKEWDTKLQKLGGPATVATAVSGLLSSDLIASTLGIHIPSAGGIGSGMWRDRASLIEANWIGSVPELGDRFDRDPRDGTGFIILNSTDARSKCRVLVSQLTAPDESAATGTPKAGDSTGLEVDPPLDCSSSASQPAASGSLDLMHGDQCSLSLDWAAAAMLSGRFPIITPAGRLPSGTAECTAGTDSQLIDGGYAEGSGLGTISDIAPDIANAIRGYNATVDPEVGAYAMPILLFLRNGAGFDLADKVSEITAEPLVPIVGFSAKGKQSDQNAWVQRITASLAASCPTPGGSHAGTPAEQQTAVDGETKCAETQKDLHDVIPDGVVVVAPSTRPTIVPPLGWALSSFSRSSLSEALSHEMVDSPCDLTNQGYARFCGLLKLSSK
ncbi:hypothetical protein [Cryobacterium sp. Y82]|uniref:hypothetical protein n=1 Tax=Cryobacterium sp. Y82 TaxID=2045017 RepID=UPI000CE4D9D9|nr:hypothetical protein [Cryobacterium sp. Y82]